MRNGDDLDDGVAFPVNHGKRESVQKIPPSSVGMFGPATRLLGDLLDGVVDFGYKSVRSSFAAGLIPFPCGDRLGDGLRVEFHRTRGHSLVPGDPSAGFGPGNRLYSRIVELLDAPGKFHLPGSLRIFVQRHVQAFKKRPGKSGASFWGELQGVF